MVIKLTLVGYTPNGGTRVACDGTSQEVIIPADSILCFISVEIGNAATDMYVKCALDATATTTSYIYYRFNAAASLFKRRNHVEFVRRS
jgi:hypothetical protein